MVNFAICFFVVVVDNVVLSALTCSKIMRICIYI